MIGIKASAGTRCPCEMQVGTLILAPGICGVLLPVYALFSAWPVDKVTAMHTI